MAIQNNMDVKNEALKTAYLDKLRGTVQKINNTEFVAETGQVNSMYYDNKVGVLQTFKMPMVYKRQQALLDEEFRIGSLNETIQKQEVKRIVGQAFFTYIYTIEKIKLLISHDSVYQEFLRKATLRFEKGESNLLEKSTAEYQRGQINLQLNALNTELDLIQLRLKYFLNTVDDIRPIAINPKLSLDLLDDKSEMKLNPKVKLLEQELMINKAKYNVEKTNNLPEITAGYLFQTMRNTPVFWTGNYLSYAQFGVSMPLFKKALRNKLNAISIQDKIIDQKLELQTKQLESQLKEALRRFENNNAALLYYEKEALANSKQIATLADLQYANGEINYMDWVLLMNQVVTIQSDYQDALLQYNESILYYNYLKSID
jgi:cobalt-zinc-cadmium resistance protein CzcA